MKSNNKLKINVDYSGGVYTIIEMSKDGETIKSYYMPLRGLEQLSGDLLNNLHPYYIKQRKKLIEKNEGISEKIAEKVDTTMYAALKRFDELFPASDYSEIYIEAFRKYDYYNDPEKYRDKILSDVKDYLEKNNISIKYNIKLNDFHRSLNIIDVLKGREIAKKQAELLGVPVILNKKDELLFEQKKLEQENTKKLEDNKIEFENNETEFEKCVDESRKKKRNISKKYEKRQKRSQEYLANKREEREKHKEKARKRYEILKKRLKEQEEYLKKERLKRRIKGFFPGIISGIAIKLSSVKSDLKSFNKRRKRKKKIIRKPKVIREPIRYRLDRILNSERITVRRKNILRGGTAALAALMLWGGANYAENHRVNSWKDSTTNVEINMDNTAESSVKSDIKQEKLEDRKEKKNEDKKIENNSEKKIKEVKEKENKVNEKTEQESKENVTESKSIFDMTLGSEVEGEMTGKYYETPEETGNFGYFENHNEHGNKVITVVDFITPNGLRVYRDTSKTLGEMRKEVAEMEGISENEITTSVHFEEKGGHVLGWVKMDQTGKPKLVVNQENQSNLEK